MWEGEEEAECWDGSMQERAEHRSGTKTPYFLHYTGFLDVLEKVIMPQCLRL